jgi:hypothetical protein
MKLSPLEVCDMPDMIQPARVSRERDYIPAGIIRPGKLSRLARRNAQASETGTISGHIFG